MAGISLSFSPLTATPGVYTITAAPGSYTFTGTDAATTKAGVAAYTVTATAGSYAFTGTDATITEGGALAYTVVAAAGSYAFTGAGATAAKGMASPAFRSSASLAYASRTNSTIATPTGVVDDDILIATVFAGNLTTAPPVTPPAGWTQIGTTSSPALSGFFANYYVWWKRAAGEPANYTFTHIAAFSTASIVAYSGCIATSNPIDVFSQATGTGTTASASSITPVSAGDCLLYLGHNWNMGGAQVAATVTSVTPTIFATNTTAHQVAMPATVAAGELLVCFFTSDGNATVTTPSGWTLLYSTAQSANVRGSAFAKIALGTEGGTTVNLVTSANEQGAAQVYRIAGSTGLIADVAAGTALAATNTGVTTTNPPGVTAAWGAENNLFISAIHMSVTMTVTVAPAGWGSIVRTNEGAGTASGSVVSVRLTQAAATGDPGVWTLSGTSAGSICDTVVVRGTTADVALSPPTGMTERRDGLIYAADEVPVSGATGTRSQTFSTSQPWSAFLIALKPVPAPASVPATLTYELVDYDTNTLVDNGTYTFPMTSSATTAEERLVILAGIGSPLSVADFDAVTVDGVVATRVGSVARGASDGSNAQAFLIAYRAAGTANGSFNVIATANCPGGGMYYGVCACFRLTNATTLYAQTSTATDDPVLSVNTIGNGTTLAAVFGYAGPDTMTVTWSGLTERLDQVFSGNILFSAASADISSSTTPLAVSADISAPLLDSNDLVAGIALSFNPVSASTAYSVTALPGSYQFTGTIAGATLSAVEGIAQTGTVITTSSAGSTANTGTFYDFITVPADTELALVGVTGHTGVASGFATVTMPKGGVDVPMTRLTGGDVSTSVWQAALFYMVNPDTGSGKLLTWDWAGSATISHHDGAFDHLLEGRRSDFADPRLGRRAGQQLPDHHADADRPDR